MKHKLEYYLTKPTYKTCHPDSSVPRMVEEILCDQIDQLTWEKEENEMKVRRFQNAFASLDKECKELVLENYIVRKSYVGFSLVVVFLVMLFLIVSKM